MGPSQGTPTPIRRAVQAPTRAACTAPSKRAKHAGDDETQRPQAPAPAAGWSFCTAAIRTTVGVRNLPAAAGSGGVRNRADRAASPRFTQRVALAVIGGDFIGTKIQIVSESRQYHENTVNNLSQVRPQMAAEMVVSGLNFTPSRNRRCRTFGRSG